MIPNRYLGNVDSKVYTFSCLCHGNSKTFIFRGYNPYMGGLKPSFFMVLGSKGVCYINFGSFVAAKRRLLKLFFLQGLAEAMKIASHQDDLHEEILEATTVLCK